MCPNGCCAPPECRGKPHGYPPVLGFQGDIGAGTGGSFAGGARSLGVTQMDGVEIARGLSEIKNMQESGSIDRYYAAAARNAYIERTKEGVGRVSPFETPSPFRDFGFLAPGAVGRAFRGKFGPEVGASVQDACHCTPRQPDAEYAGWLVYYVPGGILLTPTLKCIGYYNRPVHVLTSLFQSVFRNALEPEPVPDRIPPPTREDLARLQQPAPVAAPPALKAAYLCYDPRITPGAWRVQSTPCVPPQIAYPE